jgi:hypothetical protein
MTILADQLRTYYFTADSPNIDSSGSAFFSPGVPITVYEVGCIATTAIVHNSANVVVTVNKCPVAGTVSNATALKTWTVVPNGATLAAGKGSKVLVSAAVAQATNTADNSLIDESPTGPFDILPGESLALTITTAAASGVGNFWVRYSEHGLNGETQMVNYTYDL